MQSVEACWRAIEIDPFSHDGHLRLCILLAHSARSEPRESTSGGDTSTVNPTQAALSSAATLMSQGQTVAALRELVRVAKLSPYAPEPHYAFGGVLNACGAMEQALVHYDLAARLRPGWFDAWDKAAIIASALGLVDHSAYYISRAIELRPSDALSIRRALALRAIEQSPQSIDQTRQRLESALDQLLAQNNLNVPDPFPVAQLPIFYLAYHGKCNRTLSMKVSQVLAQACPALQWSAPHTRAPRRPGGRIKIGFASHYLRYHSIGRTTAGLVARLSREQFEVSVINLYPGPADALALRIQQSADHCLNVGESLKSAQSQIAALELDVLFYQDVGLESLSYYLAHSRLAPVQCVSYGHPDTTGIPNMDYFVSNDLYERPDSSRDYSEQLFLLHNLPTLAYYYRPTRPGKPAHRQQFGLNPDEHIYLCAQTLFKLHPDFDQILAAILRRDPRGRILLIRLRCEQWCVQLRQRFERTMPDVAERISFFPGLPPTEFLQLLAVVDVVLDTPHFNGMNSSLEALAVGSPIVTLPTSLQRGRHTQAMYRTMDIGDCIAKDAQDYVDIATNLANDSDFRRDVSGRILERNHVLFENDAVTREFERFFTTAVRAAPDRTDVAANADSAERHSNRGFALAELKRWDEALASFDRAIALKTGSAEVYSNRGVVLKELQRPDEALASFDKAIALRADYAKAHCNRGVVLKELKRLDEALASFNHAVALKTDFAQARFNRSLSLLLQGDFDSGWIDYESRWESELVAARRAFRQPLWLGRESVAGKTLLLYGEQGLGDTLQFCRYAQPAADLGAKVILEVQQPLKDLLADLQGVSRVIGQGEMLPEFDYQCPLLSLPLAFGTRLETIPAATRYLAGVPAKLARWQARLGEKSAARIGLVWSGGTAHKYDHNRSIALEQMLRHLPSGLQYMSLQKEVRESDRQSLQSDSRILHWGDELHDFADTAALCECMDVVISVDTSVAHLSAALGKETWILLPWVPDWRWLLDREDSPWYPSARLYRQPTSGDWASVLGRVAADLMVLPGCHAAAIS
jgi:predicted O-linked N-acetylglucosamine transferase (SPINDLY family)